VKFIKAYEQKGVPIYALTVENEPLAFAVNYPTMRLEAKDEADIVKRLVPLFAAENLKTRIWIFDHNFVDWWYPREILDDKEAAKRVDGVAFHGYRGDASSMTSMHDAQPDKRIIFSEGSKFGVDGAVDIVRIFQNWASTYMAWVTMLDTSLRPNSGPFHAHAPMLTLHRDTLKVDYNFEYYMYGQFSKFIRRGAVRIQSRTNWKNSLVKDDLPHVAFLNSPSAHGSDNGEALVLVVVNVHDRPRKFRLRYKGWITHEVKLPPESVSTFRWHHPTVEVPN